MEEHPEATIFKINQNGQKIQLRAILKKDERGWNLAGAAMGRVMEKRNPARKRQVLIKPW